MRTITVCHTCLGRGKAPNRGVPRDFSIHAFNHGQPHDGYTVVGCKCSDCNGTGEYSPVKRFSEAVSNDIVKEAMVKLTDLAVEVPLGGMLGEISGMKVFSEPNLPRFKMVQFRFPRSKGRRIKKKFAKCVGNFKQVPFESAFVLYGDTLVVHPDELRLYTKKELKYGTG